MAQFEYKGAKLTSATDVFTVGKSTRYVVVILQSLLWVLFLQFCEGFAGCMHTCIHPVIQHATQLASQLASELANMNPDSQPVGSTGPCTHSIANSQLPNTVLSQIHEYFCSLFMLCNERNSADRTA